MEPTPCQADALTTASETVRDTKAAYDTARTERERLIREIAATGLSVRMIASLTGLSYQRIGQITGRPDDRLELHATLEAWCPKCGAMPGARCDSSTAGFHGERHVRRNAIQDGEVDDVVEGEPVLTLPS